VGEAVLTLRRREGRPAWAAGAALVIACALAALVCAPSGAAQAEPCDEDEQTDPADPDAQNLLELQTNAKRPTFVIKLDYASSGTDWISFVPKGGKRPGRNADVAAEFTDALSFEGERLGGVQRIAAHANKSGRWIVVEACIRDIPDRTAGRYEGTISVFGPPISDFTYAIVVTTKWPRWAAIVTMFATVLLALAIAVYTDQISVSRQGFRNWKTYIRVPVTVVIALVLAAIPYWSVYENNETWGAALGADLTALVTATFGATVAGIAAANRFLAGDSTEDDTKNTSTRIPIKRGG
jgi:hypothetical protein